MRNLKGRVALVGDNHIVITSSRKYLWLQCRMPKYRRQIRVGDSFNLFILIVIELFELLKSGATGVHYTKASTNPYS